MLSKIDWYVTGVTPPVLLFEWGQNKPHGTECPVSISRQWVQSKEICETSLEIHRESPYEKLEEDILLIRGAACRPLEDSNELLHLLCSFQKENMYCLVVRRCYRAWAPSGLCLPHVCHLAKKEFMLPPHLLSRINFLICHDFDFSLGVDSMGRSFQSCRKNLFVGLCFSYTLPLPYPGCWFW